MSSASIMLLLLALVASFFVTASSLRVTAPMLDDGDSYFCGATSPFSNTVQSLIANVTIDRITSTYTIVASIPVNFPLDCIQMGSYTFQDGVYKFVNSSSSPLPPGVMRCSDLGANLTFLYGAMGETPQAGKYLMLNGVYSGSYFSISTSARWCFARVPSAKYCGQALDVPANCVVGPTSNTFQLNIEPVVLPCTISGIYILNEKYDNIQFAVGSSNCTQYLIFNNVSYKATPSPALLFQGSAYGVGFNATLSIAQC